MKKKNLLFLFIITCIGLFPRISLAETYDGEYTIEYLLKNYNAVTLGNKKYNIPEELLQNNYNNKGSLSMTGVEGAILVNGNCTTDNNAIIGTQTDNIKSFIKGTIGNNTTVTSQLVTDHNYIDFEKLYINIMNESQIIAESSQYNINSQKMEISTPGIYTINNTAAKNSNGSNNLLIKNYDKNNLYIFNYYNEYIDDLPNVMIMENGEATAVSLKQLIENNKYTGNIIFNFPNAILISIDMQSYGSNVTGISGNIIAPKACVSFLYNYSESTTNYENNTSTDMNSNNYYGTIISNSIRGDYYNSSYNSNYTYIYITYSYLKKANYTLNKVIVENENDYIEETKDFSDDYYTRNYSISDLLQNYSLITLGHKAIDSKSKIIQYGNKPGSIKLFHITGPILISGDTLTKIYENELDPYLTSYNNNSSYEYTKYDRIVLDLESNKVTESHIKGNTVSYVLYKNIYNGNIEYSSNLHVSIPVVQEQDNMANDNQNYRGTKNKLFISKQSDPYPPSMEGIRYFDNYLNFERLYNNIVKEQAAIEEGEKVTENSGKAHIKIGGNYVIDNINDINEIVFDNFDDNKNKITVITVKDSGDINFPLISKDTGAYKGIVTNDYFGKKAATHFYEQDTFINEDSYYGNIVWNLPNATYIKLKENAPFAGHLIAPNADVETPELHFSGCFIVNSIYGEGNTEAHFYPLTATATYDVPEYNDLTPAQINTLNNMRLDRLLGGTASEIETTVLGDKEQYRKDMDNFNKILDKEEGKVDNVQPITEILTNPATYRNIGLILIVLVVSIVGINCYKKNKQLQVKS